MKRLLGLVLTAGLVAAAALVPRPPAPAAPDFGDPVRPDPGAAARASVWYCPLMDAGAARDTVLGLISLADADVGITLPSPVPNAAPDVREFRVIAPVADGLDLGEVARRGQAPGFVEYSDGPAATAAVVFSDLSVTGDQCVSFATKTWHLTGGTTREGWQLILRLFNPFPDNAKVSVDGGSEFGAVPLPELNSFDVSARSWRDVDLTPIIPFLDDLALTVTSDEGLVVPAFVLSAGGDEASWPGTGLATTWEFPLTASEAMVASLVLSNPGSTAVTAEIDVYSTEGQLENVEIVTVEPALPVRVPLDTFDVGPVGIRVRADGPLAAAVVAQATDDTAGGGEGGGEGEGLAPPTVTDLAATPGAVAPATEWLLPGAGTLLEAQTTLWLLNTGIEPATVTIVPLGEEESPVDKILVDPGTVFAYPVEALPEVNGYFIESLTPISVAWSTRTAAGTVYVGGTAVGG